MMTYDAALDALEHELQGVADTFADLTDSEWQALTLLQPFEADRPHWTVFELAGHLTISIGLTSMLIADQQDGQPGRDQVSFFIFPRSEVAPVVYDYAYTMVEGKEPADMPGVLRETFSKAIGESRVLPADTVGSGYYALMRLDEFVSSRIVEAVVHGIDLTDADRAGVHRDRRGRRFHSGAVRRPAGEAHGRRAPCRPGRGPRLGACRVGTVTSSRSAATATRIAGAGRAVGGSSKRARWTA